MKEKRIACTPNFEAQLKEILDNCTKEAMEIIFDPGTYFFRQGVKLGKYHENITFRGDGEVCLNGGWPLTKSRSLKTEEKTRLMEEAANHVVAYELAENGIEQVSGFVSRGFCHYPTSGHSQLLADGKACSLSRYPRGKEYIQISGIDNEKPEDWNLSRPVCDFSDGFYCADKRLKDWDMNGDVCVFGYWSWEWASTYELVESFDCETGKIMMRQDPENFHFPIRVGQRICFYNILEELQEPGDYCIDIKNGVLYYYPKQERECLVLSSLQEPIFELSGVRNIRFENLQFEMTCGMALSEDDSEQVTVNNCSFSHMGTYAIDLFRGRNHVVENCTIHDCGEGGILVYGGNRCTLEPMNTQIRNNHIYRIGQWCTTYRPGIQMVGVGITASHNLLHDMPHSALIFWGNDMTVSDNEIYRVLLETGDAGAIYTGRDYTFRGNKVNHNYIHHLSSIGKYTVEEAAVDDRVGIYNDDAVSGTEMKDNYLEDMAWGMELGGGRDYMVKNNVFVKCNLPVMFDCRAADEHEVWRKLLNQKLKDRFFHICRYDVDDRISRRIEEERLNHAGEYASAMDQVYLAKYPELRELGELFYSQRHCDSHAIPGSAEIANNVTVPWRNVKNVCGQNRQLKSFWYDLIDVTRGVKGNLHLSSNYIGEEQDFEDFAWSELELKEESPAWRYGYCMAHFEEIGLQEKRRRENPARVKTCLLYDEEKQCLKIGLRNKKNEVVSGNMYLETSSGIELEKYRIFFTVEGKEEKWYAVTANFSDPDGRVFLYSDVPGVRPSSL